ncbi:MAG: hypothetical protein LBS11_01190 [Oscillospiraceae bacterium]|jgi:hypothetical protein|nr:hypothetical protein [Oscillospiraceae bacterium]
MSQQYFNSDGTPFTNLTNAQVYDASKNLACGWKWTCMDPCCGDTTGAWPNNRCSCCDLCDSSIDENDIPPSNGGETDDSDDSYSKDPCCYNGTCCPCKAISGDAPPLYPQSIGCGRRHVCKIIKTLPLCAEQLDEGTDGHHTDLPGRPPHTIVCVRATGAHMVQYDQDCLDYNNTDYTLTGTDYTDLNLINPDCHQYNLWVRFKVPLEVIVRDCSGYLYCLRSFLTELVRIPLTAQIHNLSNPYLYTKVRVRLCYPNQAEATTLYLADGDPLGEEYTGPEQCAPDLVGPTFGFNVIDRITDNAFRAEDQDSLAQCLLELNKPEDERECHWHYTFGTHACVERDDPAGPNLKDRCSNGNPKLDILIEACVTIMVPGEEGASGGYLVCNRTTG